MSIVDLTVLTANDLKDVVEPSGLVSKERLAEIGSILDAKPGKPQPLVYPARSSSSSSSSGTESESVGANYYPEFLPGRSYGTSSDIESVAGILRSAENSTPLPCHAMRI